MEPVGHGNWKSHTVRELLEGSGPSTAMPTRHHPAQFQIVTETWNRVVRVPHLVHMPEKDRLLMSVCCDEPHRGAVFFSDDHGATWSEPRWVHTDAQGKPDFGAFGIPNYVGEGNLLLATGGAKDRVMLFSRDYGETWGEAVPIPLASDGKPWYGCDPCLVDRDSATGKVKRLAQTGYQTAADGASRTMIRFSTDEGRTWGDEVSPPQWSGTEVALCRAANGDIVAGCRTARPDWYVGDSDHYAGLGVSISRDDGKTWSEVSLLYDYGRMHPCMVLLPNDDIVMSYVVRRGYPEDCDGFPQFGIEAVVSHDNGVTWDIDHRFILYHYSGTSYLKASHPELDGAWRCGTPSAPQNTSTILMPDGSFLTTFGLGYRRRHPSPHTVKGPYDIGLVEWRLPPAKPEETLD